MSVRAPWLLPIGMFTLILATASGHLYSIDGLQYYRVATELVFDGSIIFDPPVVWGGPIREPITTIGFSLVQVPAVVLAWPLWDAQPTVDSTLPYDPRLLYADPLYVAVSWVNPAIASVTGAVTSRLAVRLGLEGRWPLVVGLAAVFATPLFFYARADFLQPLTALLLLALIAAALHVRDGGALPVGLLALIAAWAVMTRPPDAAIAFLALAPALALKGSGYRPLVNGRRYLLELAVGVVAGSVVSFAVNLIRRGRPLDFGYPSDGFTGAIPDGLLGELISPGRGLFWYLPLAAIVLWGSVVLWQSGRRIEVVALLIPVPAYMLLYSLWKGLGGWAWGPRFLVPLAPLLVLLAAGVLLRRGSRVGAVSFLALGLAGIATNLAHLGVDQLRFWGEYGDSIQGTAGFSRQFELGAYAPIGSWSFYDASAGPDILWIRATAETGGASLVVGSVLALVGIVCLTAAFRGRASPRAGPRRRAGAIAQS